MGWRVWVFRSLVCTIAAAVGMLAWLIYLQTNSHAIQARVIEQIRQDFPQVEVQIGSAWLRPLGGLWLRDVKLFRRDDPAHPFLIVPTATVFHDKEQLTAGRLLIRKIELTQPVLRLRRDADGNWNLPDWPKAPSSTQPAPILVVRHGRIVFEDRRGGVSRPVLEFDQVQLTLVNDPISRVTIQGSGNSVLGIVRWSGIYERTTPTAQIDVDLPQYTLTRGTLEQLASHLEPVRQHLLGVEGQGAAQMSFRYAPGHKPVWQTDVRFRFQRGHVVHPRLPLKSLSQVEFSARYRDGRLWIDSGRAQSGPTRFTFQLEAALPTDGPWSEDPEEHLLNCHLSIDRLTLSGELFERLPENLRQIHRDFNPNGPVGLTFKLERKDRWWSRRIIVHPEGIAAEFVDFPYRLEGIRGKLEQVTTSDGVDELRVSLTGLSAGKPIIIEGISAGSAPQNRLDLRIHGRGQRFDDNLRRAMGRHAATLERFHPIGTGDFVAQVRNEPGDPHTSFDIQVDFTNLSVCHESFPYPLENVSGTVRIRLGSENSIHFEQIHGLHRGGEVALHGTYRIRPIGDTLSVRLRAAALPVDSDLVHAFAQIGLSDLVREMQPAGQVGIVADLFYHQTAAAVGSRPKAPSWEIQCHHFTVDSVTPLFLPYELNQVQGAFHYAQDTVMLREFHGQHRASRISIGCREEPSVFKIKSNGGIWARLSRIQVAPLIVDDELLRALPGPLRSACMALGPAGPMTLSIGTFIVDTTADAPHRPAAVAGTRGSGSIRLSGATLSAVEPSPWMYWRDLTIRLSGASCRLGLRCENAHGQITLRGEYRHGRLGAMDGNVLLDQVYYHGQPLQDFHTQIVLDPGKRPGVLQVRHLKAKCFGGALAGEAAVVIDPIFRYDVRLTGWGLRLEDVSRHNRLGPEAELAGRAEFHLFLAGTELDVKSLRGGGYIRVPKGRIYNLPPLVDLLKFIKLQAPDGTFFDEAQLQFQITGTHVELEQFDLVGNLISLTGNGRMKLDGSDLHLDVYPVWLKLVQMLPPGVREIPQTISRNLYKIEMTGTLGGRIDLRSEAVPILVEPVRRLLERMRSAAPGMGRP